MPQIFIDYTSNLGDEIIFNPLAKEIHSILNNIGKINLNNCKTRIIKRNNFIIGDDSPEHAFIHIKIAFLEGRSDELKKELGGRILERGVAFLDSIFKAGLDTQVTVQITDIPRAMYFKHPKSSLSKID